MLVVSNVKGSDMTRGNSVESLPLATAFLAWKKGPLLPKEGSKDDR